jgi:hypothetical protein
MTMAATRPRAVLGPLLGDLIAPLLLGSTALYGKRTGLGIRASLDAMESR